MFCSNCGFYNEEGVRVCINCNCPLVEEDESLKSKNDASILDSKIEEEMTLVEDNIYSYNGSFIIVVGIRGFKVNFGHFDSIQEAIEKRDLLLEDGWPIPEGLLDIGEEVSKNIFEKDGRFIVANVINGENVIFGQYNSLKEANIAKFGFIKNKWRKPTKPKDTKRTKTTTSEKYVYHIGNRFEVKRSIKGTLRVFGTFDNIDDAIIVKKVLDSCNWSISKINEEDNIFLLNGDYYVLFESKCKISVLGKFDSYDSAFESKDSLIEKFLGEYNKKSSEKYVYKRDNKFVVQKLIDGKRTVFGRFDNKNDALIVKDFLQSINWDISKLSNNPELFSLNNKHYIIKGDGSHLDILDIFDSYDEAASKINNLNNSPDSQNSMDVKLDSFMSNENSTKQEKDESDNEKEEVFELGQNVHYKNDQFVVQKSINGEQLEYGQFDNKSDALIIECFLNDNLWNIQSIKDEINIFFNNDKYYVIVNNNNNFEIIGNYDSYEEAFDKKESVDDGLGLGSVDDGDVVVEESVDDGLGLGSVDDGDVVVEESVDDGLGLGSVDDGDVVVEESVDDGLGLGSVDSKKVNVYSSVSTVNENSNKEIVDADSSVSTVNENSNKEIVDAAESDSETKFSQHEERLPIFKKLFYKLDEETNEYRLGKIKTFIVVESTVIFIFLFYIFFITIESSRGNFISSLLCALISLAFFIIPSYIFLIIIKKVDHFFKS